MRKSKYLMPIAGLILPMILCNGCIPDVDTGNPVQEIITQKEEPTSIGEEEVSSPIYAEEQMVAEKDIIMMEPADSTEQSLIYKVSKMNGFEVQVPDFLTEEQQELFAEAYDIQLHFHMSTGYGEYNEDADTIEWTTPMGETYEYMQCDDGIFSSFQDFREYLEGVYSLEAVEALLMKYYYIEYNGKLYYMSADRGNNIMYDSHTYELLQQDADKIRLKACIHYSHPEFEVEEPYGETYFTLVNTDKGWRFSAFELWK